MERSVLGWLLIGLFAGALGKSVLLGRGSGGFTVTILLGIAGALLAGFLATAIQGDVAGGWATYAAALGGSVILLVLYRLMLPRRAR